MSLTIQSATWANAQNTAAVIQTVESGAVAISQSDTPSAWTDFQAWITAGNTPAALPGPSSAAQRSAAFLADATRADILDKLMNATLPQIDTYIENNVANLADAKAMLKKILKVLALNIQR